jgi:hypothetical protein
VPSEWWTNPPPASQANARNDEFDSDTLNPAWVWYDDPVVGTQLNQISAVNNVDLSNLTLPAVPTPRYKLNNNRRASWLEVQVPRSTINSDAVFAGGSYWLLKPLTPNADDTYYTRVQTPNFWNTGGFAAAPIAHFLVLMAATAGVPDKNNAIIIGNQGIGNATGGSFSLMYTYIAGSEVVRPIGSFNMSVGSLPAFGIQRRASSNWNGFFFDALSGQTRPVGEFAQAFTPAFIGWWFRVQLNASYPPIFAMDLLRCPAALNILPI